MNKSIRNKKISIIGPCLNEKENLQEYVERCIQGLNTSNIEEAEIIIIDDGSTDGSAEELRKLQEKYPILVKPFFHRKNFGLTEALNTGFSEAEGDFIIWISVDLESHPDEDIPLFIEGFSEGFDVVSGSRIGRGDGKNFASSIYNLFCNFLFKINLKDMNWMKGFDKRCLPFIDLRGDWHRFIIVMLHDAGFRITEKNMNWYARKYGESKFGFSRFPKSMIDAMSVWFVIKFSSKPMRFFGSLGLTTFLLGLSIHFYLITYYFLGLGQIRPLFWAALVLELISIIFVLIGFIAELIEKSSSQDPLKQNTKHKKILD